MNGSIDIKILDRLYTVACAKDEEVKIKNLSNLLEKKAKLIKEKYGIIPERNLLFMIALMIADEAVKVHNKNIDHENNVVELKAKIDSLEKELYQKSQDKDTKLSETQYIIEKILNRVQQINLSIKDEIKQLSLKTGIVIDGEKNE